LDLQLASRSILSSSRWSFRALPVAAALLAFGSAVFGQSHAAVASTTALTAAPAGGASGKTIFTAHVSPVPAQNGSSDRGSVTLEETGSDGQPHSLGSAFVGADGTATLTVSALPEGSHAVRAVYSGGESSAASSSAPAEITAQAAAAPDFSLSITPATLNLDAGVQGTVAISITPLAGFNNYVSLSCAGLPLFTTCNFLPSNVDVTAASLSTMTLNTTAPSGNTGTTLLRHDAGLVYAFLLPGGLGLVGLCFGRHRGLRMLAMLCVVVSLIGGASSCSARYQYLNFGPPNNPGTPNGQSIIRIYGTAVSGALSTSKCVQVTLNMTSTNTTGSAGNILTPCS
jgi:Bacterial Ig-like domain (group 3)